ncbi:hypothetical protein ACT91Q_18625 [Brevibacillus thermoruber]|uniref:hypothetical protein n=1 Tax=Brevibacillus thermoruber TaxID=33942 RepID=UPI0040425C88
MIRRTLMAAIFMAVSFWTSTVLANSEVTYPHLINDRVEFYGDFSPSPGARPEVHRADVLQWEYYIYDDKTKKTVEQTAIASFNLKENTGENFKGFTGYSMIYLPDDPNERINKIKALATKYRGNPEFVSRKVEEYINQVKKGTLPDPIYQTYVYENGALKTYNWLSAGHFAYLVGGTDSLERFGDRCIEFIGKPCGTSEKITKAGFPAPPSPNSGRAMLITTPYPVITAATIQQNQKPTTNVVDTAPFGIQASFITYSGWETGGGFSLFLNGNQIPITNGANPYLVMMPPSQSLGKDGEFGYKYSFYRDLTNYKQILRQGKNTLLISVNDSFERYQKMEIEFNYGTAGCQPVLVKMRDATQRIYFPDVSDGSTIKYGGPLVWGLQYNSAVCSILESVNKNNGIGDKLNQPIRVSDIHTSIFMNRWEFKIGKSKNGVILENHSKDTKPLVAYLIETKGEKFLKRYVVNKGQSVEIVLPTKKYKGEYSIQFPSPLVDSGFWAKATATSDGMPASYTYPDQVRGAIQAIVNFKK